MRSIRRIHEQLISRSAVIIISLSVLILGSVTSEAQTNTFPASGNVGIGTTSPTANLHVVGSVAISKGYYGGDITDESGRTNFGWAWDATNGNKSFVRSSEGNTQIIATQSGGIQLLGGNVGIGTTNPRAALHVHTYTNQNLWVRNNSGPLDLSALNDAVTAFVPLSINAGALYLNDTTGGNVGIGTSSPARPLHVYFASGGETVRVEGASNTNPYLTVKDAAGVTAFLQAAATGGGVLLGSSSNHNLSLQTNATTRMTLDTSGNVGIGTTTPGSKLDVGGDVNILNGNAYRSGTADILSVHSGVVQINTGGFSGGTAILGGNVGIGTTSPGYKLDVNGTINSNSTITGNNIVVKYQDVAEWVPASEQLSAGTVVVLDSTKSNQVTSSSTSYDTRVAGVVSEQPGLALGEKSAGKVLVATTGRVRVKVDATKGSIHIGDLLVTSDVPGFAMRSEAVEFAGRKMHMPGTLIGKALEPLEKGKGEILVLLSLQ
jgi:hypothetical protein